MDLRHGGLGQPRASLPVDYDFDTGRQRVVYQAGAELPQSYYCCRGDNAKVRSRGSGDGDGV